MFNIGLLSDAALTGLSAADKESMQKQATQQFLLGSLLSGDPGIGFKSASDIPATALNMQDMLRKSQLAQSDQAALEGFRAKYTPTRFQEANPAYMGPVMPEQLAQQEQIKSARAQGLPFNIQNALQDILALPSASQSSMLGAVTALQPKMQPSGILLNPNMQAIGGIPTFDAKTGLVSRPVVQGGNVDFSVSAAPGYGKAVESNLTYALQAGEMPLYDRAGNLVATQPMPGSAENLRGRKRAEAEGGAFGIPETVIDPVTKQKVLKSRADVLGLTTPTGARGATSGGSVVEVSPEQQTLDAATNARFLDFSKKSLESADSASGRKIAAEQLYDLATQVNNNKLTGLQAGVYGYMNAIPGVGKLFEQDITDVTRMTQMIKTAQLEKTAMQKGAASNLDATTIEKSYASITDPASSTRMAAAFEVALADKDVAKNQFVEAYKGDPGKISTAWQNSPENKPIFAHPKFNQFLTEQVNAWSQGGAQGKPVLPAGFTFGTGKKSGEFQIKRPDGSIYRIGQ
jgi:hypothetical protein